MIHGERIDLYNAERKMGEVLNGPMAFACIATGVVKMMWKGRVIWNAAQDTTPTTLNEWVSIVAPRMNAIRAEMRQNLEAVIAVTGGAQ